LQLQSLYYRLTCLIKLYNIVQLLSGVTQNKILHRTLRIHSPHVRSWETYKNGPGSSISPGSDWIYYCKVDLLLFFVITNYYCYHNILGVISLQVVSKTKLHSYAINQQSWNW